MTAPTREGSCDHLATKADAEFLRADIERFRADFSGKLRWFGIAIISAFGAMMSVVVAFIKLTG